MKMNISIFLHFFAGKTRAATLSYVHQTRRETDVDTTTTKEEALLVGTEEREMVLRGVS